MTTVQVTTSLDGRRRGKSHAVARRLRQQIVDQFQPGHQLPTFNEMERTFGVSRAVLREAVDRLKAEGFIYSVDRRGLYVTNRPPHLSRFALAFPQNPSSPEWPRFFTAIQQVAMGLQQERGDISFTDYFDLDAGPGSPSYDRLRRDVQAQRLAGVLFMPSERKEGDPRPFSAASVPELYICGSPSDGRVPSIATDGDQMCDRMIAWLRERGRRRVAVVAMSANSAGNLRYLIQEGVPLRPHWVQTVGRDNVADVRKIVALLMDYPPDERPDGLIILDDNLTEHALGGLIQCDVRIGQDIEVIAHCNWPWPVACPAPVQRVGFHARHILDLAIRAAERIQAGQPLAADFVRVPALFEHETSQPWNPVLFDPPVQEQSHVS